MKLQRFGKDGQPRNEFKEIADDQYESFKNRTDGVSWRPVQLTQKEHVERVRKFVPSKHKTTNNKKL